MAVDEAGGVARDRSLRIPCMPCARSLAPVLGAVVVYGTSCVRWYVACSARRSHRRARSRDTRSHVGACPGHRARLNRRYGCAVAWMAYSIVVPHCLSMVSCPGSAVRSNTTCKKRYMDVNFHVHPPQLGEGPMCYGRVHAHVYSCKMLYGTRTWPPGSPRTTTHTHHPPTTTTTTTRSTEHTAQSSVCPCCTHTRTASSVTRHTHGHGVRFNRGWAAAQQC